MIERLLFRHLLKLLLARLKGDMLLKIEKAPEGAEFRAKAVARGVKIRGRKGRIDLIFVLDD